MCRSASTETSTPLEEGLTSRPPLRLTRTEASDCCSAGCRQKKSPPILRLRRFEIQEGLRKQPDGAALKPPNRVDFLLVEQAATSKEGYAVFFVDVRNRVSS